MRRRDDPNDENRLFDWDGYLVSTINHIGYMVDQYRHLMYDIIFVSIATNAALLLCIDFDLNSSGDAITRLDSIEADEAPLIVTTFLISCGISLLRRSLKKAALNFGPNPRLKVAFSASSTI